MAKILIVEDENFFANALDKILRDQGHSCVYAANGHVAHEILQLEDFDCVITDVKMPVMSGPRLAAWIRHNKPTPIIILAAFSELGEAKSAFGPNAGNLLIKPFVAEEVRVALAAGIPPTYKGKTFETYEAQVAMPKSTTRPGTVAEFNIYHYVDGHPQKLVNRGETFSPEKLKVPIGTRFYTDRESLSAIMASSFLTGNAVATNTKIDTNKRTAIMQDSLQVIMEQAVALGIDQLTNENAVNLITTYFKSIGNNSILEMIADLDMFSRPIYAQTLAATTVCLLLAHELQYSAEDCFKLTTAALFHDIGKTMVDQSLLKTPRILLSVKDRTALEKHVQNSVAVLQKSGNISAEVCGIIWQHHESILGTGYPRGLKHKQIHPMARLLRVADEFCTSVMKSAGHPGMPPMRAIEALKASRDLDQDFVVSLTRLLVSCKGRQVA